MCSSAYSSLNKLEEAFHYTVTARPRYHPGYRKLHNEAVNLLQQLKDSSTPKLEADLLSLSTFMNMVDCFYMSHRRKLAVTTDHQMVLVPRGTQMGDHISLVKGGDTPFVIRPTGTSFWTLLGDCYVDSIMLGEAFEEERCQDIVLV
jgi:hypothetical protein